MKSLLLAVVALPLAFAAPAAAKCYGCGANGVSLNGTMYNGSSYQGTSAQGVSGKPTIGSAVLIGVELPR